MATPLASCTLAIKAVPNAPRNAIVGWLGEALKVKVHAPAQQGRANALALPRRAVTLRQGDTSRQKIIHVAGLTLAEVRAKLGG